jgi:putative cell wall-binding protein
MRRPVLLPASRACARLLLAAALAAGWAISPGGPAAEAASAAEAAPSQTAPGGATASYEEACGPVETGYARCFVLRRTDLAPVPLGAMSPNAVPDGYDPADIQDAYQLPVAGGSGLTIAVVDAYDLPSAEADLAVYRSQFGLPVCTTANGCFHKIDQRGGTSYPASGVGSSWDSEIVLDLDMVSAACPNCSIVLVEADSANSDDLGEAVDAAVAFGAVAVSNSYGAHEWWAEGNNDVHYNHPGVLVTASTGDYDYSWGVEYPAASPYVVAVGGTTLRPAANTRGWTETAWDGTGSGCSIYEPKPIWQTDPGCGNKTTADVSAVADPAYGVAVYDSGNGGWQVYGGTSAGAPIVAAGYALIGQPAPGKYLGPLLYDGTFRFNDVATGANGSCGGSYLCTAIAGFDGPTGMGTPIIPSLPSAPTGASALAGNASALVSWSAPADDGDSPISSYHVTSSPGGFTCSSGGSFSCIVTGLSNGTPYTFSVTATNLIGTGPASGATGAVTPLGVPGRPTGVKAIAGETVVAVSWTAPGVTGSGPITGYTATSSPGGKTCTWTSGPLTCNVTGLTGGTAYTFTVRATNAAGTGLPSDPSKAVRLGAAVVRYSGASRFETAAAISANTFDADCGCTAYVAYAYNFPDALAGAAAAGTIQGPVLLVNSSGLINSATATELTRLAPSKIVVLGSATVISNAVAEALRAYASGGNVVRFAGTSRFATAAAISANTFDADCGCTTYVAYAYNFPDALAGAAAAGTVQGPVLLVSTTGAINSSTAAELTRLQPTRIVVLGSTSVISSAVATALVPYAGAGGVVRYYGASRFDTATAVSANSFDAGCACVAYIAYAYNFPDALAGAAAAGTVQGPVLLVNTTGTMHAATTTELTRLAPYRIIVLGSEGVISAEVFDALAAYVQTP